MNTPFASLYWIVPLPFWLPDTRTVAPASEIPNAAQFRATSVSSVVSKAVGDTVVDGVPLRVSVALLEISPSLPFTV
ncbi:hypothetical protein D3C85_1760380 [compost metagenome]